MTALDQAIIKAYLRQGGLPAGEEIEPADPTPLDVDPVETADESGRPESSRSDRSSSPAGPVWRASVPLESLEFSGTGLLEEFSSAIGSLGSDFGADSQARTPIKDESFRETSGGRSHLGRNASGSKFESMLRIDSVSWPRPSRRLRVTAGKQIERLADAVRKKAASGSRVIGVAGCSHGEGCTTVLLALAMRLAELDLKILLLDGDVVRPTLPEQLAIANEVGWRDVVRGTISLEDAVTQSDSESVALLPYAGRTTPEDDHGASAQEVKAFLDRVRGHYDAILVDFGGAVASSSDGGALARRIAEQVDTVLTVYNVRATSPSDLAALRRDFRRLGVAEAGIIENFVDDGTA